jgi:SAM-dependent methyltransferase
MAEQEYDRIGAGYSSRRRADVRLAELIRGSLGDSKTIINVGAGAGSYESLGAVVVGVEPALTMIRQRPETAAPCVRAYAEALPFPRGAFAASMAILTIHHWRDWKVGLSEMRRVSRDRLIIFTWDPGGPGFWWRDYLPEMVERDRARFPSLADIQSVIGQARIVPVPIPHDCEDGFMGAYWRRPAAYLEPGARAAISSLAGRSEEAALGRLADDLARGQWSARYGHLLQLEELDLGYRLVIVETHR